MSAPLLLIKPKDPFLQKFIKTYYFHCATSPDFKQRIVYFPNHTSTLNIYQNTKLEWEDNWRTHSPSNAPSFTTLLVGKFNRSRAIQMLGSFSKWTIVFHPLGLNHFVDEPLSHFIEEHFSFFDYFDSIDPFQELLPVLFSKEKIEEKRDLLDAFFLSQFNVFQETRLVNAVQKIMDNDTQYRVGQLAKELKISRKTLLRLFQKHLSYSVEEYLSVVKFRKALIQYQNQVKKPSLTQLAYDSHYYDQADFNHQLKLKTGLSPRVLFKQLQTLDKGLYWSVSG